MSSSLAKYKDVLVSFFDITVSRSKELLISTKNSTVVEGHIFTLILIGVPVNSSDIWEEARSLQGRLGSNRIEIDRAIHSMYESLTASGDGSGSIVVCLVNRLSRTVNIFRSFPSAPEVFYCADMAEFCASDMPEPPISLSSSNLDRLAIAQFFRFGACAPGRTLFNDVKRLETGACLEWTPGKPVSVARRTFIAATMQDAAHLGSVAASTETWLQALHDTARERARAVSSDILGYLISGGIDSSLGAYVMAKEIQSKGGRLTTFSALDENYSFSRRRGLSEAEAIQKITIVIGSVHYNISLQESAKEFDFDRHAGGCYDGIGSSLEYDLLLSSLPNKNSNRVLLSGFCADGLIGDLSGHARLRGILSQSYKAITLHKIQQFVLEHRLLRGVARRLVPQLIEGANLYELFPIIETIAGNELLLRWFDRDRLVSANEEYMLPDSSIVDCGIEDPLKFFLMADITRIGMGTKQRIDKAARLNGFQVLSSYWSTAVMQSALQIPLDHRNSKFSKRISRDLVRQHFGADISDRGKHGFSRSFAKNGLDIHAMQERILDSKFIDLLDLDMKKKRVLENDVFKLSAVVQKYIWHLFCIGRSYEVKSSFKGTA